MTAPAAASWSGFHASAVVVGESGVLARGPSGAGKSSLALALIALAREAAIFAALIGDDRVFVRACGGRLLARGVPRFAGLIERRFEGLVVAAHEPLAVVRLVVDLAGRGAVAAANARGQRQNRRIARRPAAANRARLRRRVRLITPMRRLKVLLGCPNAGRRPIANFA